jgi:two-component system NtrC family response regulator
MTHDGDILPLDPRPLVLVVEDDPVLCSIITRMVGLLGYAADGCGDARSALARVQRSLRRVRLVLADLGMPGIDGGELAERLQDLDPRLRVALMADHDSDVGDLLAGYADFPFLPKPVTTPALADLLLRQVGPPVPLRDRRPSRPAKVRHRTSGQQSL